MTCRVRIAPSPTGEPHVGTAYIALFNLAFARALGGTMLLRIEDTDQTRSRTQYEKAIYDALKFCKITWDEGPDCGGPHGPYRQSERTEIYRTYADKMVAMGIAYPCFATPEELATMRAARAGGRQGYDRRYRNLSPEEVEERKKAGQSYVIRLKMPRTGMCQFEDGIKGTITTPWADVDDQILLKSDGFPTYHLANVVDDYLMGITHVIRGDEWVSSTPKHCFMYDAMGWQRPQFYHMPLLMGADGKKLSKRKNPTSIFFYQEQGYLPEALTNFLTLMGYRPETEEEMYSLEHFLTTFDPKRLGSSNAFFDHKKLDWLNQRYLIEKNDTTQLLEALKAWKLNDTFLQQLLPLCQTRIKNLGEFMEQTHFFFTHQITLSEELLAVKGLSNEQVAFLLASIIYQLDAQEDWGPEGWEMATKAVAQTYQLNHKKQVMPPLFGAIMGKPRGLPLFASTALLNRSVLRARLLEAITFLGGVSNKNRAALDTPSKAQAVWQKLCDA